MADVRSEPLGRLVQQHPAWVAVLEQFGIDGRGGATHTLLAATDRVGVDIELVVAALAGPPRVPVDCDHLERVSLRTLVDHVEQVHHRATRTLLGELAGLLDDDPRGATAAAREALSSLAELLEAHLVAEELVLFPLCRDLLDAFSWPSFHVGPLEPSLEHVVHDHHLVERRLAVLDAALAELAADGPHPAREVLDTLRADLERHLSEEEWLLLPAMHRLAAELAGR